MHSATQSDFFSQSTLEELQIIIRMCGHTFKLNRTLSYEKLLRKTLSGDGVCVCCNLRRQNKNMHFIF